MFEARIRRLLEPHVTIPSPARRITEPNEMDGVAPRSVIPAAIVSSPMPLVAHPATVQDPAARPRTSPSTSAVPVAVISRPRFAAHHEDKDHARRYERIARPNENANARVVLEGTPTWAGAARSIALHSQPWSGKSIQGGAPDVMAWRSRWRRSAASARDSAIS